MKHDCELHNPVYDGKYLHGEIKNDSKGRFDNGTVVTTSTVEFVKTKNTTYKIVRD